MTYTADLDYDPCFAKLPTGDPCLRRPSGGYKRCSQHGGVDDPDNQCGSKLRGSNPPRYCRRRPAIGRTRCKLHGGASPRGANHPRFTHGRYSDVIPHHLRQLVHEGMEDPDYMSMKAERAILSARLAELLSGMDEGSGGGAAWLWLRSAHTKFKKAMAEQDADSMADHLDSMSHAINSGSSVSALWLTEILPLVDAIRKIAEAERKRVEAAHRVITVDQALATILYLENGFSEVLDMLSITNAEKSKARKLIRGKVEVVTGA